MPYTDPSATSCCDSEMACVFARALLAREATCSIVQRRDLGYRDQLDCTSVAARDHCATLMQLMHRQARPALRLPPPGRPLMQAQLVQVQRAGLELLRELVDGAERDVHAMVGCAIGRHGSLDGLPWQLGADRWAAAAPRRGIALRR